MPAALWKMAEGSVVCAVNAPAKPMPRAPCSNMAKPAAPAVVAARARLKAVSAPRAADRRWPVDMRSPPTVVVSKAGQVCAEHDGRACYVALAAAVNDEEIRRPEGRG